TSKALSAFVQLVRREIDSLDKHRTKSSSSSSSNPISGTINTIITIGCLTKALTAYACLQYLTYQRTVQNRRLTTVYEGVVRVGDDGRVVVPVGLIEYPNMRGAGSGDSGGKVGGGAGKGMDAGQDSDEVTIRWWDSHSRDDYLTIEIQETHHTRHKPDAKNRGGTTEDANHPIRGEKANNNEDDFDLALEDAKSYIDQAWNIRKDMDTVDDAVTFIEEAAENPLDDGDEGEESELEGCVEDGVGGRRESLSDDDTGRVIVDWARDFSDDVLKEAFAKKGKDGGFLPLIPGQQGNSQRNRGQGAESSAATTTTLSQPKQELETPTSKGKSVTARKSRLGLKHLLRKVTKTNKKKTHKEADSPTSPTSLSHDKIRQTVTVWGKSSTPAPTLTPTAGQNTTFSQQQNSMVMMFDSVSTMSEMHDGTRTRDSTIKVAQNG
ncbi:hypothetical protein HK102_011078, partial [Quaeritorhiza haematococci]